MSPMRLTVILLSVFAFIAPASVVEARRGAAVPISLRMTAYVNEAPEGRRAEYKWTAEHGTKKYVLHVMDVSVVGRGVTASDIDRAVNMYPTAFRLAGDDKALRKIETAPPGRSIELKGYLRIAGGTRILMLDTVELGPAPPTP